MNPSVSVVVPAYNAAAYLGEALESVFSQRGVRLDVVVVDDGSTDATPDIARRFAPRARLVSQANRGIGAARNAGLAASDGAFVAFLDADDLWPEGRLRVLLAALEARPAAGIAAGKVRCFASPELDEQELRRIDVPEGEASGTGMASASLIARAAIEQVGPLDETLRVGEMVDWYLRARDAGIEQVDVNDIVLLRRIHRSNQGRRHADARSDYLRALRAAIARRRGRDNG